MQTIIQWVLAHVNPMTLVAAALSFLVGLSYLKSKLDKSAALAVKLADLLEDYAKFIADHKIDSVEAQELWKDIQDIVTEIKK